MISLRKHIDEYRESPRRPAEEFDEPALNAFRSSLGAIAQSAQRAVPPLGDDLSRRLLDIQAALRRRVTAEALDSAARRTQTELAAWADLATRLHEDNEREMKEIVGAVALAAESVAKKDEKYSNRIGELSARLKSIAGLSDLPAIRKSIVESAAALKTCVEQMTEESKASLRQLSKEVENYREKLRETERLSTLDPLTGVANRRGIEIQIVARMKSGPPLSVLMIDLNGFKDINDRHGHLAGDDLLKKFAAELKADCPQSDLVGRWGGDEFIVLSACDLRQAGARADRVRAYALGEYEIDTGSATVRVELRASIGVAEWDGTEQASELLARADAGLYRAKGTSKRSSNAAAL